MEPCSVATMVCKACCAYILLDQSQTAVNFLVLIAVTCLCGDSEFLQWTPQVEIGSTASSERRMLQLDTCFKC